MKFLLDMGVDIRSRAMSPFTFATKAFNDCRTARYSRRPSRRAGSSSLPPGCATFDLDFGEIAALARGRKASVVVFRLHNTRTGHVLERLAAVLADCSTIQERGAIIAVEEDRHRIRLLPVGHDGM